MRNLRHLTAAVAAAVPTSQIDGEQTEPEAFFKSANGVAEC